MPLSRRRFLTRSALAGLALPAVSFTTGARPAPARSAGGRRWRHDAGTFHDLRGGVGYFTGQGGTIAYYASPDAVVAVDAQFPDSAAVCAAGLRERAGRGVDLLVSTHHHGDHTAGNGALGAARILAHEGVPGLQLANAVQNGWQAAYVPPSETYRDAWRETVGTETIAVTYYGPAHTAADSVVHFEGADVVHTGDLVFNRMPCFLDLPAGATTAGWIASLERLHAAFSDRTTFVFGHGGEAFGVVGTRADVLVMRDFLTALYEHARAGLAAGRSPDEIAATDRLPAFPDHYDPTWPDGIQTALRAMTEELSREG